MEQSQVPTSTRIHVSIAANAQGRPGVEADFGRVTVVLGANGTGKSQLLRELATGSHFLEWHEMAARTRPVIYVEGGRKSEPPAAVPQRAGLDPPGTRLDDRLRHIFVRLVKGRMSKALYDQQCLEWYRRGREGPEPQCGEFEICKLFRLYSTIFPAIQLDFEEFEGPGLSDALGSIRCTRGGEAYDPTRLSDGEKQILILLADLVFASPPAAVFLIDEPELHLQPKLAETFLDHH